MILVFREEGIETELIQVGSQAIRGCMDCGACAESGKCVFDSDPVNEIAAAFEAADALVVASPNYYNSPSGTVISLMDRLFRSTSFSKEAKVGACYVCGENSESPAAVFDVLNQYFAFGGMKIASVSFWRQESGESPADEAAGSGQAQDLARSVSRMVKALEAAAETEETPEFEEEYVTSFVDGDFDQLRKRPVSMFFLDGRDPVFPDPRYGSDTGLLAVGGALKADWLKAAYSRGIFPWYDDGAPLMWFCPQNRFVILPSDLHVSKNMKSFMKKHTVTLELNRDFADTMHHCRMARESTEEGTWITDDVEKAYLAMWKAGHTFSAEAFVDGELAGGLYGIRVGRCLMGESMFSLQPNGSKMALTLLIQQTAESDGTLMFDCQEPSEYLVRMGGKTISYDEYMRLVRQGLSPVAE